MEACAEMGQEEQEGGVAERVEDEWWEARHIYSDGVCAVGVRTVVWPAPPHWPRRLLAHCASPSSSSLLSLLPSPSPQTYMMTIDTHIKTFR